MHVFGFFYYTDIDFDFEGFVFYVFFNVDYAQGCNFGCFNKGLKMLTGYLNFVIVKINEFFFFSEP